MMKYLKNLVQILLVLNVLVILYKYENYVLFIFEEEISLKFILLPLLLYFIVLYINKNLNITFYYKIILNLANTFFSIAIGRLWYKTYITEYTKSDFIINGGFLKLLRKWDKFDFKKEAETILFKKDLYDHFDFNSFYTKVNPKTMGFWREKLNDYIVFAEQNKKLVFDKKLDLGNQVSTANSGDLISYMSDKYFLIGASIGIVLSGCIILYIRSEYSSNHAQYFISTFNNYFYPDGGLSVAKQTFKEIFDILLAQKAIIQKAEGAPILYVDKIRMTARAREFLDFIIEEASSDSLNFDDVAVIYNHLILLMDNLNEFGKINFLGRRHIWGEMTEQDTKLVKEKLHLITKILLKNNK